VVYPLPFSQTSAVVLFDFTSFLGNPTIELECLYICELGYIVGQLPPDLLFGIDPKLNVTCCSCCFVYEYSYLYLHDMYDQLFFKDNAEWPAQCVAMAGNKGNNLFKMIIYMPLTLQNSLQPSAIPKFYLNI
jgi:hypothetical protein